MTFVDTPLNYPYTTQYDPFAGTPTQTFRHTAYVKVWVDGVDVTNRLEPFLVSVAVYDGKPFTCELEVDDRDGRLPIPPIGGNLLVYIGWSTENVIKVFTGFIKDVEHGFHRKQGGRRMWVHGDAMRAESQIKTPQSDHLGDGAPPGQSYGNAHTLQEWLSQVGATGGISNVVVGPSLQGVANDYWAQSNESMMNVFSRLADDYGAQWRVEGDTAYFVRPGDLQKPNIVAQWRDNLIGWRVHPYAARPAWQSAHQEYYDHILGQWTQMAKQFGFRVPFSMSNAVYHLPAPAPNMSTAQNHMDGAEADAAIRIGWGRIIINGEPQASFLGNVTLSGARPGVDGSYWIGGAQHSWSRQGYVTTLDVWPNQQAAQDGFIGNQGYNQQTVPGTTSTG